MPFEMKPSALSAVADEIWKKAENNAQQTTPLAKDTDSISAFAKVIKESKPMFSTKKETNGLADSGEKPHFVFGEKIQERAVNSAEKSDGSEKSGSSQGTELSEVDEKISQDNEPSTSTKETTEKSGASTITGKSLVVAAAAYEESKKLEGSKELKPVELITGEENESNVLNLVCKIFVFDKVKGCWAERGKGTLRINDANPEKTKEGGDDVSSRSSKSRIVFRAQGSLKVVLNSKLWADMLLERVSQKALRISAFGAESEAESTVPGIYLITGGEKEIGELETCIRQRISLLKDDDKPPDVTNSEQQRKRKAIPENSEASTKEEKSRKLI